MSFFGNSMWDQKPNGIGKGYLVANNFATSNPKAKPVKNTIKTSDSFIGTPLAVNANSPPAGPIETSLQMAGAKEGWRESTTLGKTTLLAISVAVFVLTVPNFKEPSFQQRRRETLQGLKPKGRGGSPIGYIRSLAFAGGALYLHSALFDKMRAAGALK
jgi:hypothetical protein